MFKGSFTFSVDAKGRLSIPSKIRRDVRPDANNIFVLTRGPLQCIDVYPHDEWKLFESRLNSLNIFNPKEGLVIRRFLQEAVEEKLDAQNRILLPKNLIEFAGIEKEVFILGALNKFELWNPRIYKEYLDEQGLAFEEAAQQVMTNK